MMTDAQIVIVGATEALERLRCELPSKGIEMRPLEDFLMAYDRETLGGEEKLRHMEALYASLRGKLVVRLMLVNLNPEAIRVNGDRLQEVHDAWIKIEERLADLLHERQNERIYFVTVLITEEGDWTEERREILESFSRSQNESCFQMRCYLMTRLLELGHDRVIHARDAWPAFVGGLVCHFLWRDAYTGDLGRDGDRRRFFEADGLFAWRTLRIVARVPAAVINENLRGILIEINRRFFGERPEPLFLEALQIDPTLSVGSSFKPCVENPFDKKKWNELGESDSANKDELQQLEDPIKWQIATENHALNERDFSWNSSNNEPLQAIVEVGSRIDEAMDIPGRLFPGGLPSPAVQGLPEVESILQKIQEKIEEVENCKVELREWWIDHVQAACGFVVASERWIVAVIVSIALSYGLLLLPIAIHQYLPGSLFPLSRGLMLTGAAVTGVISMLLIGYLTQRSRGRFAHRKLIQRGAEWIKASEELRETVANALRHSRQAGSRVREASARRQLIKRLSRIEQVLSAELQFGTTGESESQMEMAGENNSIRFSKLLELAIESNPNDGFEVDELVEQTTRQFFSEWRELLKKSGERVMIPASAVLELCQTAVSGLRQMVEAELTESAASRLGHNHVKYIMQKLREVQIDGDERHFYSIDLKGGVPRNSVWHRSGLSEAFPRDRFEKTEQMEASRLTKGTLAVLYGECPLSIIKNEGNQRLQFDVDYSSAAPTTELGGAA